MLSFTIETRPATMLGTSRKGFVSVVNNRPGIVSPRGSRGRHRKESIGPSKAKATRSMTPWRAGGELLC